MTMDSLKRTLEYKKVVLFQIKNELYNRNSFRLKKLKDQYEYIQKNLLLLNSRLEYPLPERSLLFRKIEIQEQGSEEVEESVPPYKTDTKQQDLEIEKRFLDYVDRLKNIPQKDIQVSNKRSIKEHVEFDIVPLVEPGFEKINNYNKVNYTKLKDNIKFDTSSIMLDLQDTETDSYEDPYSQLGT